MADHKQYVGIDVGGTKILAGVVDASGAVLASSKDKTQAAKGLDSVIDRICACVAEAVEGAKADAIAAVGVGVAGAVDFGSGTVLAAGNIRWSNVPLAKLLGKRLGLGPVVVDNDVNTGTYAEWRAGAGKGHRDLLGVFVGTGIGGGLVLNGDLYRGHFHTAGEIGHTIIQAGGGGTRRSLEDLASRGAMGVTLGRRITTNHPSVLSEWMPPEKLFVRLRSKLLAKAYRQGDEETVRCVREAAGYTGTAIANAITMLSLPRVVVGGGVVEAMGAEFVDLVAAAARADIFPPGLSVEIVAGDLADDAVMVGAALLARDQRARR